jgi:hypothetical protein
MNSFQIRSFTFSSAMCLCAIISFLPATACKQDDRPDAQVETLQPLLDGKEFNSDMAHYSLLFPKSWTINSGERGVVTGWSKPEDGATVGASVTVFPGALDSPMSAADLMTRYLEGMKRDGLEKTEEHHGEVNGRDAVWVVVNYQSNGVSRRGVVLGTTEGETAYVLTCSTSPEKFDGVRPTFEGVLGTFKVTN